MARKRYNEEDILRLLREVEVDVSRFRAAPGSHLSCYTFKSQGAFPA